MRFLLSNIETEGVRKSPSEKSARQLSDVLKVQKADVLRGVHWCSLRRWIDQMRLDSGGEIPCTIWVRRRNKRRLAFWNQVLAPCRSFAGRSPSSEVWNRLNLIGSESEPIYRRRVESPAVHPL